MTEDEVRQRAFAMPLTSPAYPKGPYRLVGTEYLIFTCRSDPAILEKIVPAPLKLHEPLARSYPPARRGRLRLFGGLRTVVFIPR